MHVFYKEDIHQTPLVLDEEESKHCVRVLRMEIGAELYLADGKGQVARAVITDANPKKCVVAIQEIQTHPKSRNYKLHIAVAPTKNFDRMEWFIEKATECGIDEITFIETANSERNKINHERCLKIAISAMKQSKQWHLPIIHSIQKFNAFCSTLPADTLKLIAWCEIPQTEWLSRVVQHHMPHDLTVLIGPEGDFTKNEVDTAIQAGCVPVSLGSTILRTETAALFACMSAKTILG